MRPTSRVPEELAEAHVRVPDQLVVRNPDVVEVRAPGVEAPPADPPHLGSHRESGRRPFPPRNWRSGAAVSSSGPMRANRVTPKDMSVRHSGDERLPPVDHPTAVTSFVLGCGCRGASEPASGSVSPKAPEYATLGQRPQPPLSLPVVAEKVQRERADRHMRLPEPPRRTGRPTRSAP